MFRTRYARTLIAVAIALAVWGVAGAASAAPAEPTLGLTALQARLDAAPGGSIPGYFKTVTRGADITTIPVDVLAIAGAATDDGSLVLFQAKGPLMDAYGGIVAGMSGSPVYIEDGGVDKIVGAVSYGDYFTLGGTGLATPIEQMMRLEDDYPRVEALSAPVVTAAGVIDRVVVSPDPGSSGVIAGTGALVAEPLSSFFIGGLKPGSRPYQVVKQALEKRGGSVVPLGSMLAGSGSSIGSFSTPLVSGASVALLASRGDMWVGGIGTVTYAASDTVLAFGHPLFHDGNADDYMCNAWIDGIWPSSMEPYKLGRPAALRGTFVQDRAAGALGRTSSVPADTLITGTAVDAATGRRVSTSVSMPRPLVSEARIDPMIVDSAATLSVYKLVDAAYAAGSIDTTTTIRVSDGRAIRTVTLRNMYDSSDVLWDSGADADMMMGRLLSVLDRGVDKPEILSIDVQSSISAQHRNAEIVGIDLPEPPHEGANLVRVQMKVYGIAATRTVETSVDIPEGTSLSGLFTASSSGGDGDGMEEGPSAGPDTVAGVVDELATVQPNNVLTVTYSEQSLEEPEPGDGEEFPAFTDPWEGEPAGPIVTSVETPWVLTGEAQVATPMVMVLASPPVVAYNGMTMIDGIVMGPEDPVTVKVYGSLPGTTTETLLAEDITFPDEGGVFMIPLEHLTTNMHIRVRIGAAEGWTPAEAECDVRVAARTILGASARTLRYGGRVTLTGLVAPASAAGTNVAFDYLVGRSWKQLTVRRLAAGSPYAKATYSWKPPKGTWKVRARYVGGPLNVSSLSPIVTISVR